MFEKLALMIATKVAEKVGPWLIEQITKLIPVIVGAVVKALSDQLSKHLPDFSAVASGAVPEIAKAAVDKVIEADPDLPGLSNIFDLSEFLKKSLNL